MRVADMARRPRVFAAGLLYHAIARGNRRQAIFHESRDYRVYLHRLARYRLRFEATVHAYCLMPNHVHILIQAGPPPLAGLMQALQQSYTQYFNRTYATVGHLFQGRYKAFVCHRDSYLARLVRYIHLNPVRAGLVTGPDEYPYSSHGAYVRGLATPFVDPTSMLRILGGPAAYRELLGGACDDSMPPEPDDPVEESLGPSRPDTSGRSTSRLSARPLSHAVTDLALRLAVEPATLASAHRDWKLSRARSLIAFVLVKQLGYPVTAVAEALRRRPASISSLLYRLTERMEADPRLMADADNLSRIV
jgi:REP element-mobilizing transposase RayT